MLIFFYKKNWKLKKKTELLSVLRVLFCYRDISGYIQKWDHIYSTLESPIINLQNIITRKIRMIRNYKPNTPINRVNIQSIKSDLSLNKLIE